MVHRHSLRPAHQVDSSLFMIQLPSCYRHPFHCEMVHVFNATNGETMFGYRTIGQNDYSSRKVLKAFQGMLKYDGLLRETQTGLIACHVLSQLALGRVHLHAYQEKVNRYENEMYIVHCTIIDKHQDKIGQGVYFNWTNH